MSEFQLSKIITSCKRQSATCSTDKELHSKLRLLTKIRANELALRARCYDSSSVPQTRDIGLSGQYCFNYYRDVNHLV